MGVCEGEGSGLHSLKGLPVVEVDCDCVNEMAVAAVVEECVWLVLGKKVEW